MLTLKHQFAGVLAVVALFAAPFSFVHAEETIVDIASGNPDFSALVDAVVSQDLAETLASEGPFTVFAPVNSAFESLPGFVTRALESKPELLSQILLYHVVADDLDSSEVLNSRRIDTIQGMSLVPSLKDGIPYINNSQIVVTDITASNGTIHVIDKVLLPRDVVREAFRIELERIRNEFRSIFNELRHL